MQSMFMQKLPKQKIFVMTAVSCGALEMHQELESPWGFLGGRGPFLAPKGLW